MFFRALAVREAPGWNAILAEQIGRTKNPDRKARLQFAVPALSSDPAKAKFEADSIQGEVSIARNHFLPAGGDGS